MDVIEHPEKMITVIVLKDGKELIAMVTYHHINRFRHIYMMLCIVCKTDSVCDSLVPTGQNGTCYRNGITVFENYQMCNVTSKVYHSTTLYIIC